MFRDSYVPCIYVMNILMYVSHIAVSGYGTLLLSILIIHYSWQILQTISSVFTELIQVSLYWSAKTGLSMYRNPFLPYCGCVNTTIWIHHMDTNKTHGEKSRGEQQECYMLFWINPQNRSCATTYLPSQRPSK